MTITAEAVKILRERTGAGMMECKKALVETKGDLDAAAEMMRKAGLAKADKKAGRVAAEGGRTLGGVQDAQTTAGAGAQVEKPPAATQGRDDPVACRHDRCLSRAHGRQRCPLFA